MRHYLLGTQISAECLTKAGHEHSSWLYEKASMSCFICLPSYFTVSALPKHAEIPSSLICWDSHAHSKHSLGKLPYRQICNLFEKWERKKKRIGEKAKGQRTISLLSHVLYVVMKELSSESSDDADIHALCSISLLCLSSSGAKLISHEPAGASPFTFHGGSGHLITH